MNQVEETKIVNVFNPTTRKIRCIENEHDYLGDGTILKEEKLIKGEIYTFVKGEMASYGSMVFLREVPSKHGFQSYLFEEMESYERQIAEDAYKNWLFERLEEAEEDVRAGRVYLLEEVKGRKTIA
ncbi:MAG: hypothetical protein IJZ53_11165 [Tyzzerella sp.]|nr:hypothetical protein [Tyzzerella sp.]